MSNSHGKSDSSPLLAKVLTAHGGLEIGSECAHCRHTDRDRHRTSADGRSRNHVVLARPRGNGIRRAEGTSWPPDILALCNNCASPFIGGGSDAPA